MHIYCFPAVTPNTYSYNFLILCVQLNESDFKVLVVTDDSSVVLNQLHVNEQGTYRCSLQGQSGTVFYRVTFLLTGKSAALKCISTGKLSDNSSLNGLKATSHPS